MPLIRRRRHREPPKNAKGEYYFDPNDQDVAGKRIVLLLDTIPPLILALLIAFAAYKLLR